MIHVARISVSNFSRVWATLGWLGSFAASRAAAKIEHEAKKRPDEPRADVQLNREALEQLVQVLSEKRWRGDPHKVAHLRLQAKAYARGEWAPRAGRASA